MFSGSSHISTYSRSNVVIWMILAFQAGLINIGGWLSAQTFVSHVTGYVSLASLEFESNRSLHAISLLVMLLIFLLGSLVSGILIDLKVRENKAPQYYLVFGLLFLLTLGVAVGGFNHIFGEFGAGSWGPREFLLVALLCLTCGVQNGMITLVSKSVVRTTHVTGLVTDLGIGLVRSFLHKEGVNNESRANGMRVGIILTFFLGSFIGVPIFRTWQFRGFVAPCFISFILFVLSAYFYFLQCHKSQRL